MLRFEHLGSVLGDPFYDAAVRSMGLSWHNFFFGAMEPSGSVSIDKPPLDLWLQVAFVKAFGLSSTTLKLPQALFGTAAVPLMFLAVRRLFGVRAGLGAALALAVLPIEVITARSDTMDAVMMALCVLALAAIVRAAYTGRTSWLLWAAAAMGLAFNVKLFESVIALPGLALFGYLAMPGSQRRRLRLLAVAALVYVAVALSWLTATLLFPAHERPFAIGSTNGSAWNAALVYNGLDRLTGKSTIDEGTTTASSRGYPQATQAERNQIPITGPSATRLLVRVGPLSGERLGLEVLAALLLGLPALLFAFLDRREETDTEPPGDSQTQERRIQRAALAGLMLWLLTGIVLFSQMARLHPRYTEAFTPTVAAVLGIGVAWVTSTRDLRRLAVLAISLIVMVAYSEHLLFGSIAIWWVTLVAMLGTLVLYGLHAPPWTRWVATLVALLAIPLWASREAVRENTQDTNRLGVMRASELDPLSAYLIAHQGSAYYQVAYDSATKMGALVLKDGRPVLPLTVNGGKVFTSVARLRSLAAAGQVRYALLSTFCGPHTPRSDPACSAPALWIRAHSIDVSRQAGFTHGGLLWRLP